MDITGEVLFAKRYYRTGCSVLPARSKMDRNHLRVSHAEVSAHRTHSREAAPLAQCHAWLCDSKHCHRWVSLVIHVEQSLSDVLVVCNRSKG